MEKNQIRQAEIDELYALDLPELRPSTFEQNFAIFTIAFLFCALILSLFIKAPTSVEVNGKLVLKNPSIPVRALRSFTVNENNLIEEQYVAAGATLVTSSSGMNPSFLRQINQIIDRLEKVANMSDECVQCLVEAVQISSALVNYSESSQFPEVLQMLNSNKDSITALAASLPSLRSELRQSYAKIEEIDRQMKNKRGIASVGTPQNQVLQLRQQALQKYTGLSQQFEKLKATYLSFKEGSARQAQLVKTRLTDIQSREGIKAPISGKVINVKVRGTGEFVQAGQVLFEIVPENSELIAQLEVLNKDIGKIKVGGNVDIAFDAYPEFDFGRMPGVVSKILEPEQSEQANPSISNRGFRVQVGLSAQQFRAQSKNHELRNGMTLKARIQGKESSLFMTFMRTIFKLRDEVEG